MANEVGNPAEGGIGLHEAQLAIGQLLDPETDNHEDAEAHDPEGVEVEETEEVEGYAEDEIEVNETDPEDDDSSEEVIEQELPEDLTLTVKVDGEELEVTLDELKKGYSRYSDYTRKATALAEERKAFHGEVEAIRRERAQYAELLPVLQQQLQMQDDAEPDWDTLFNEDPIEAAKLERQWRKSQEQRNAKLAAIEAEQKRIAEETAKEQMQAMAAFVEAERAKLPDVIPEWKDGETAKREANEIREWGLANGLTPQELDSLRQASHVALLRKAMLFDKGQKKVVEAKQQPKRVARIVKPGTSGTQVKPGSTDLKRMSQRLQRTGRVADAAALLDKLI